MLVRRCPAPVAAVGIASLPRRPRRAPSRPRRPRPASAPSGRGFGGVPPNLSPPERAMGWPNANTAPDSELAPLRCNLAGHPQVEDLVFGHGALDLGGKLHDLDALAQGRRLGGAVRRPG